MAVRTRRVKSDTIVDATCGNKFVVQNQNCGYQTQIILLSTSGAASTVTVDYLWNDGAPITVGRRKFR